MEIKVEDLTRKFGSKIAINNLNFELLKGVYGLLGDNGAGKSTLMRILVAIDHQTSGKVTFNNEDIFKLDDNYRKLVGYIPQDFQVYPSFTARDFLEYIGALKGLNKQELKHKVSEVLRFVNLEEVGNKKVENFSGGMKRRVGIAQAILNDPKILIFDEPTAGLDPNERIRFSNIISEMGEDKIILFSTHIISDIEAITTNVIILANGCILERGNVPELLSKIEGKVFSIEMNNGELKEFKKYNKIVRIRQEGSIVNVRYLGEPTLGANPCIPSLEDYYIFLGSDKNE